MEPGLILRTERLLLRQWRESDFVPFQAMNADRQVRRYFSTLQTAEQSDASARRIRQMIAEHGYGFWAVEIPGVTEFAGFTGISAPGFPVPFPDCVEIGWRLAVAYWGKGYATEAARASLAYGFDALGFGDIVACTVPSNTASRGVMEKLGMTHAPEHDFDHPAVEPRHPLRPHVLYHIRRP
jgi:RimJ/RimL family protein N-acetyltransferase